MARRKKENRIDWEKVFRLRCRSKTGHNLTQEESAYCLAAMKADRARYVKMDASVFNATVPFGSNVRLPEEDWRI